MKRIFLAVTVALIIASSCQRHKSDNSDVKAKYIFLFIGDGMGLQQVNATQVYIDSALRDNHNLSFINFPVQTFMTTYAATQYITCSAAAGTALSTGCKTSIGTLGMNYNHTDSLFSVAKQLKDDGFKIGLLTTVSIDHATPAAFYAHQGSRGSSYDIAKDLLKSGYDFFASGGFVDPEGKKLKEPVPSIYSLGEKYSLAFTTSLAAIDSLKSKYNSVVYSSPNPSLESTLKYRIDQNSSDITLAKLTKKAIQILDNPKGFFMMVEGGKIDWACHSNDAAAAIGEVIDLSDAIQQAIDFYNDHPDKTLIIVTADHETGGFSLGNKDNKYSMNLSLLKNQKISKEQFQELVKVYFSKSPKPTLQVMLNLAKEKTGIGNADFNLGLSDKELKQLSEAYYSSISPSKVAKTKSKNNPTESKETFSSTCFDILNRKAAIGWTSTSHTGSPVPVYVLGRGGKLFTGRLDNTDIPKKIRIVSGIE
jgi:alkaline phosphatase